MKLLAIKKTFPLALSAIPFGIVMGTSTLKAGFDSFEMFYMNFSMFAGASQLVFVELYKNSSPLIIILVSCLLINSRMFLYSLALFEEFRELKLSKKIILSYFIIDQTYVIYEEVKEQLLDNSDKFTFFLTSGLFMFSFWIIGVCLGYFFGEILPFYEHLDFLVPLIFIAIFGAKLNSPTNVLVFLSAVILSLIFAKFPFNLGLLLASLMAMSLGVYLKHKEVKG